MAQFVSVTFESSLWVESKISNPAKAQHWDQKLMLPRPPKDSISVKKIGFVETID